jgi:uncharacterized protein
VARHEGERYGSPLMAAPEMSRRAFVAMTALLVGCRADTSSSAGQLLRVGTGPDGGVYFAYGQGLAGVWQRALRGLSLDVLTTAASVENLRLLERAEVDLAFVQADVAADAAVGSGIWELPVPMLAVARLYDDVVHVLVRADSGFETLDDLRGRLVSIGAVGSGTEYIARRVFSAAGLTIGADVAGINLTLQAALGALRSGDVDAVSWSGGLPSGGVTDLAADVAVRLVPVSVLPALQRAHGSVYAEAVIPGSAYGMDQATPTISVPNFLVVADAMGAPLVERLTSAMFAAKAALIEAHPEARNLDRRTAIFTEQLALHPGALAYYRRSADQPAG